MQSLSHGSRQRVSIAALLAHARALHVSGSSVDMTGISGMIHATGIADALRAAANPIEPDQPSGRHQPTQDK